MLIQSLTGIGSFCIPGALPRLDPNNPEKQGYDFPYVIRTLNTSAIALPGNGFVAVSLIALYNPQHRIPNEKTLDQTLLFLF
jgi:hypothetical protein